MTKITGLNQSGIHGKLCTCAVIKSAKISTDRSNLQIRVGQYYELSSWLVKSAARTRPLLEI